MHCFCHWRGLATRLILCCTVGVISANVANAVEGGASAYPAGVETVTPGLTPPPGGWMLCQFNDFYMANGLANSKGQSEIPGFHLRVGAFAQKLTHNWGLHVLGGTLVSYVALPLVYESLNAPFGSKAKTGFGNPDFQVAAIAYAKGPLHWWYGFDVLTPGFSYGKTDLFNIGQHNFAYAPQGAFTFLPMRGRLEVSSKLQYIINGSDSSTAYHSGREFVWEYDGMVSITRKLSAGGNGFFYRQVTADMQNGLALGDASRGRDFAFGPEVKYHFNNHLEMIAKYERDMLVENHPLGNAFWLQFGMPLWRERE
jgi:hypothetical protein